MTGGHWAICGLKVVLEPPRQRLDFQDIFKGADAGVRTRSRARHLAVAGSRRARPILRRARPRARSTAVQVDQSRAPGDSATRSRAARGWAGHTLRGAPDRSTTPWRSLHHVESATPISALVLAPPASGSRRGAGRPVQAWREPSPRAACRARVRSDSARAAPADPSQSSCAQQVGQIDTCQGNCRPRSARGSISSSFATGSIANCSSARTGIVSSTPTL